MRCRCRPSEALERFHRRGLAGPVGAEQSYDFAEIGVEADTVDRDETPVTNDQVIDLDSGHRREASWGGSRNRGGDALQSTTGPGSAPRRLEPVAEAANRRDENGP